MDIFDPTMAVPVDAAPQDAKGKGKGPATTDDADEASSAQAQPSQDQSLEQEVQQLVAGVSSWWSGFSQKSQQQLEAARAHIQEQGGLVALAKKEAQKFEASMTEAQKQAREKALQPAPLTNEERARIAASAEKGNVKGTEGGEDEEGDKDLEESVKGKGKAKAAEPQVRAAAASSDAATGGEELFDADRETGDAQQPRASQDYTRAAALSTGAALGSAQAWFSKVQSSLRADPTLASMQKSLADTVASFNAGEKAKDAGGAKGAEADEAAEAKREAVLPHLAGTIKAALPHLSWDKSQEMARRYYNDAGSVVRELGKEVKVLAEDLVKIVPPAATAEDGEKKEQDKKLEVPGAGRGDAKGKGTDDDLGSDWDVDVESEAPTSVKPPTKPVTSQPKGTANPSVTGAGAPPAAATKEGKAAAKPAEAAKGKKDDEEDEDSDWE